MSQTWAVACTLKESPAVVQAFVRRHFALGCSEMFLFFSDPEDPSLAWASAQPGVYAEPLNETEYVDHDFGGVMRGTQFGGYRSFEGKLVNHATVALGRSSCEWIIHLDADEHLSASVDVGEWLAAVDPQVWLVNVAPFEAAYRTWEDAEQDLRTDLFRAVLKPAERADEVCRALYGPRAGLFRHGVLGHAGGKSFVRRENAAQMGIHFAEPRDPARPWISETERVALLHYDAVSFARWRDKFMMRINGEVVTAGSGGHRAQQIDAFRTALAEGEGALRELFEDLLIFDPARVEQARRLGAVLDLAELPTFRPPGP